MTTAKWIPRVALALGVIVLAIVVLIVVVSVLGMNVAFT